MSQRKTLGKSQIKLKHKYKYILENNFLYKLGQIYYLKLEVTILSIYHKKEIKSNNLQKKLFNLI